MQNDADQTPTSNKKIKERAENGWIWMDMDGSSLESLPRHPFLQVLLALGFFVPHEGELVIA